MECEDEGEKKRGEQRDDKDHDIGCFEFKSFEWKTHCFILAHMWLEVAFVVSEAASGIPDKGVWRVYFGYSGMPD